MNVSLTPQLEALIKAKVDGGLYHSASEVVRDALRLLEQRDHQREALRVAVDQGIKQADAGKTRKLDVDALVRKAKRTPRKA